ncbi:5'-deoxynucleotidase [Vibrio cholerae]|uniref:5'-deoxynucleotidase n=2 Tax=Vibrio TaxID=662 RepID=A0A1B1LRQ5_VIBPH|nr:MULTISPECIES: 5'-deoxynucleotidase [Vibrio]ANS55720.1 5'-deoxynucleotidase [Vibrio parahaemolyticus]EJL6490368.1 5'-deoxynucleotidase [Vibrio cholerae]EJL6642058.1 5'-deoxynucleotidase [Vibrio cholerae]MBL4245118.1 5'-deoxynucleotidase [Vibrio fluvialis]MBL4254052.1 5'-deoxynucleotidase [Vibrio fluvialis]
MNSITNTTNSSGYLALALRQRLIKRWSLMHCVWEENDLEHVSVVALLALMAGHLANNRGKNVNIQRMMAHGLVHDQAEILASDLVQSVKYATPEMADAYSKIESAAQEQLISTIPDELREVMASYFEISGYERGLTKACDTYSAYIKATQEVAAGNHLEFGDALKKIEAIVDDLRREFEEIDLIHQYFSDGFDKSVDALLGK